MNRSRITDISNRIATQGVLTLQDLIELQNAGLDLTEYVDRDEVSKGYIDSEKYNSIIRYLGGDSLSPS